MARWQFGRCVRREKYLGGAEKDSPGGFLRNSPRPRWTPPSPGPLRFSGAGLRTRPQPSTVSQPLQARAEPLRHRAQVPPCVFGGVFSVRVPPRYNVTKRPSWACSARRPDSRGLPERLPWGPPPRGGIRRRPTPPSRSSIRLALRPGGQVREGGGTPRPLFRTPPSAVGRDPWGNEPREAGRLDLSPDRSPRGARGRAHGRGPRRGMVLPTSPDALGALGARRTGSHLGVFRT